MNTNFVSAMVRFFFCVYVVLYLCFSGYSVAQELTQNGGPSVDTTSVEMVAEQPVDNQGLTYKTDAALPSIEPGTTGGTPPDAPKAMPQNSLSSQNITEQSSEDEAQRQQQINKFREYNESSVLLFNQFFIYFGFIFVMGFLPKCLLALDDERIGWQIVIMVGSLSLIADIIIQTILLAKSPELIRPISILGVVIALPTAFMIMLVRMHFLDNDLDDE